MPVAAIPDLTLETYALNEASSGIIQEATAKSKEKLPRFAESPLAAGPRSGAAGGRESALDAAAAGEYSARSTAEAD